MRLILLMAALAVLFGGCDWFFGLEREAPYSVGNATRAGGINHDRAVATVVDPKGAAYIGGYTKSNPAIFDSFSIPTSGVADIFVAKLGKGGKFEWVKTAGGAGVDMLWDLELFKGDLILAGHYNARVSFDGANTLDPYLLKKDGSPLDTIFVARLDAKTRKFVWAYRLGTTGSSAAPDRRFNLAVHGDKIYLAGSFLYFDKQGGVSKEVVSRGGEDIFLAQLDSSGSLIWATFIGGPGTDRAEGVTTDQAGDPYITGFFEGIATFKDSTTLTSAGESDVLVAHFSTAGKRVWAKAAGGKAPDHGRALDLDAQGNIYVAGFTRSKLAKFGDQTVSSKGDSDAFLAKMTSSGGFTRVTTAGGVGNDEIRGFTVGKKGEAMVTGFFQSQATFGDHIVDARGKQDLFISRVDTNGEFEWVAPLGGTNARVVGWDLAVGIGGSFIMAGYFDKVIEYGGANLTSAGKSDILMVGLKDEEEAKNAADGGVQSDGGTFADSSTQLDSTQLDSTQLDSTLLDSTQLDSTQPDSSQPDSSPADITKKGDAGQGTDINQTKDLGRAPPPEQGR